MQGSLKPFSTDRKQLPDHPQKPPRSDSCLNWNVLFEPCLPADARRLAILHELGYLPFSQSGGALLFHLTSKLYERNSLAIMTNLGFTAWASMFYNNLRGTRYAGTCLHRPIKMLHKMIKNPKEHSRIG